MNSFVRRIGTVVVQFGIDPRQVLASLRSIPAYLSNIVYLRSSIGRSTRGTFGLRWVPILADRHLAGGTARGHYFHQDLWAARHIYVRRPRRHIDVGSRIDGFISHLLVFREVEVFDIRAIKSKIAGLHFHQADIMQPGSVDLATTDSLSCLHALEHFGLGRYGDPINVDGWYTGLQNLASMLCVGGRLYLSVPIGPQVIEYNAQRIFQSRTILDAARTLGLLLIEFSYVDDFGDFHEKCDVEDATTCEFGCACFIFERAN